MLITWTSIVLLIDVNTPSRHYILIIVCFKDFYHQGLVGYKQRVDIKVVADKVLGEYRKAISVYLNYI
jgi:hypothetical protein